MSAGSHTIRFITTSGSPVCPVLISQVNAITLEQLKNYCFQNSHQPISYSQSYDLYAITRNSFLTYHNNALYIGYYTSNSASVLEEYDITEDGTLQTSTVDDDTITTGQLVWIR